MAYKVTRQKRVTEDLELVDENGAVVETIHVDLDSDVMAKQLSEKYLALINAQKVMQESKEADADKKLEVIGVAIIDLFESVFGKENAKRILDFYENKYIEMCQEVLPFVVNVIIPKVRSAAQQSRDKLLQTYNRKAKRKLGMK